MSAPRQHSPQRTPLPGGDPYQRPVGDQFVSVMGGGQQAVPNFDLRHGYPCNWTEGQWVQRRIQNGAVSMMTDAVVAGPPPRFRTLSETLGGVDQWIVVASLTIPNGWVGMMACGTGRLNKPAWADAVDWALFVNQTIQQQPWRGISEDEAWWPLKDAVSERVVSLRARIREAFWSTPAGATPIRDRLMGEGTLAVLLQLDSASCPPKGGG